MKTTAILVVAYVLFATIAVPAVAACGPRDKPQPMTAEAMQILPRMELTACESGVLSNTQAGEVAYVALGTKSVTMPWMPKGQQKMSGYVVAFSIPIETGYLATRSSDMPILLITGSSIEAAAAQLTQIQTQDVGPIATPHKPPLAGDTVRSFKVVEGTVKILTDANFDFAILYDPATGKRIYELRCVKGG